MNNSRRGEPPIPPNFESLLTADQRTALEELEPFGWSLAFIRRPKFRPTEVILKHSNGAHSRLMDDGELDYSSPPQLRRDRGPAAHPADEGPDPWAHIEDDSDLERPEPVKPIETPTVRNEPLPEVSARKRPGKYLV